MNAIARPSVVPAKTLGNPVNLNGDALSREGVPTGTPETKTQQREEKPPSRAEVVELLRSIDATLKRLDSAVSELLEQPNVKARRVAAAPPPPEPKRVTPSRNDPRVQAVLRAVSDITSVPVAELYDANRYAGPAEARQIAMALLRELVWGMSYPRLGKIFDRDHTTALSALQKVRIKLGRGERAFAERYARCHERATALIEQINSSHRSVSEVVTDP